MPPRTLPKRSSPRPRTRTPEGRVWHAVAACVATGATLALLSPPTTSLRESLARRGLTLVEGSVRWLDPPGVRARRALALVSEREGATDLYALRVRTGRENRVVGLADISNLTRSAEATEELLNTHGRWAAFVTRSGGVAVAVTLLDLEGAPEAIDPAARPAEWGQRVRAAVTRWQETGRSEGYGFYRYRLTPHARRVTLRFDDQALRCDADGRAIRIDAATRRVTEGAVHVELQERREGGSEWVTWMVNTVRGISWVGPEPIAFAERIAFGMKHRVAQARNRVGGDHSQREVAEDLADLLSGPPRARVEGRVEGWPPARLVLTLSPPLAREGEWTSAPEDDPFVAHNHGAPPAFYQSFVRTDRERPDTRVYVTVWDPRQIELHVAPGSQEPIGAAGETGSGSIPRDTRTLLRVAAGFNGGFQAMHGEWGVYAEGTLFLPPKPWGATVFVRADGSTGFGSWPGNTAVIPPDVTEFRQNLTAIVEDGVFNPFRRTFWGGNVPTAAPGDDHTTRTALCLTRDDNVAFFWGEDLTPRSLADGMLAARCAFGLHLDMNGANTGFEFLRVTPERSTPRLGRALAPSEAEGIVPAAPGFRYRARRMVRGMDEMGFPRYIKRDPRDFFYLLTRAVLPGAPLLAPVTPAQPGEGQWRVADLGDAPFPWPMARTRVRPDPRRSDRWVNLVRVDPRRVSLAPPGASGSIVARIVGATAAPNDGRGLTRLAWIESQGTARWSIGTEGPGIIGAPLLPMMAVTRGVGIDEHGFLVYAVADRAAPDLIAQALDLAGCLPERLALTPETAFALSADRDIAGASISRDLPPVYALTLRAMQGAARVFSEVRPVPPSVWYNAQHRRVRYQRGEDGTVRVHTVGGGSRVAPTWGSSHAPPPVSPSTP